MSSKLTAADILDEMSRAVKEPRQKVRRRFLPGLLVAFIELIRAVRPPGVVYSSLKGFYRDFPRQLKTSDGGKANTLIVAKPDGTTLSIRPAYGRFERWARADNARYDYPSMAPHATQAWADYEHWLEVLVGLDDKALADLEQMVRAFTLKHFVSHAVDGSTIRREPPRFYLFLRHFDFAARAGPTGAAYQGTVFAWIRADAPHLQVQVSKVRTGSKRIGKVGDVDARDGEALVLAAEVKQFGFAANDVADVAEFAALVQQRRALGLVAALDVDEPARAALKQLGLEPVTRQDLIDRVRLWDTMKQRNAVQSLLYYVTQVEQEKTLIDAVRGFFTAFEKALPEAWTPAQAEEAAEAAAKA